MKLAQELHKTLQDIYDLPASEIVLWEAFFEVYPFTQDREDYRTALVAAAVTNMSGRSLKHPMEIDKFLPDYLDRVRSVTGKSVEQQKLEFEAFVLKLKGLKDAVRTPHSTPSSEG